MDDKTTEKDTQSQSKHSGTGKCTAGDETQTTPCNCEACQIGHLVRTWRPEDDHDIAVMLDALESSLTSVFMLIPGKHREYAMKEHLTAVHREVNFLAKDLPGRDDTIH